VIEEQQLKRPAIIFGILLFVSLIANAWLGYMVHNQKGKSSSREIQAKTIKSDGYQAIFLSNGQVYFGKLAMLTEGLYKLTNVRYMDTASSRMLRVIDAAHSPEDLMVIPASQVLFWENLNSNGQTARSL